VLSKYCAIGYWIVIGPSLDCKVAVLREPPIAEHSIYINASPSMLRPGRRPQVAALAELACLGMPACQRELVGMHLLLLMFFLCVNPPHSVPGETTQIR
jgi:hypothetical protein